MLQTPDGHGRLELMKFHAPPAPSGDRHALSNTLGIRRIAFGVDDIDAAVAGLRARGVELVGEVERYEDSYRLCYDVAVRFSATSMPRPPGRVKR